MSCHPLRDLVQARARNRARARGGAQQLAWLGPGLAGLGVGWREGQACQVVVQLRACRSAVAGCEVVLGTAVEGDGSFINQRRRDSFFFCRLHWRGSGPILSICHFGRIGQTE